MKAISARAGAKKSLKLLHFYDLCCYNCYNELLKKVNCYFSDLRGKNLNPADPENRWKSSRMGPVQCTSEQRDDQL